MDQKNHIETDTCDCYSKKCPDPFESSNDIVQVNNQQGVWVINVLSPDDILYN